MCGAMMVNETLATTGLSGPEFAATVKAGATRAWFDANLQQLTDLTTRS
jgi:hypothetical protein